MPEPSDGVPRPDLPAEALSVSPRERAAILVPAVVVAALLLVIPVWRLAAFRVPMSGAIGTHATAEGGYRKGFSVRLRVWRDSLLTVEDSRSPVARAGLRSGDRLIAVNGIAWEDSARLWRLYDRAAAGDTFVFRVRRNGITMDVPVRLEDPWVTMARRPRFLVDLPAALAFFAVGFFVSRARPHDRRARAFGWLSLVAAVYFLLDWLFAGAQGANPLDSGRWVSVAVVAGFAFVVLGLLLPTLLLHLALSFPRERPVLRAHPNLLHWVYTGALASFLTFTLAAISYATVWHWLSGATVALAVLVLVAVLALVRPDGRRLRTRLASRPLEAGAVFSSFNLLVLAGFSLEPVSRNAGYADLLVLVPLVLIPLGVLVPAIAYVAVALVALVRSYRESRSEERAQLRWPLWGTSTAVLLGALAAAFNVFGDWTWWSSRTLASLLPAVTPKVMEVLFPLASLLIPVSFAVGILKYRLMDVEIVVRRTILYAAVSVVLVVVYLGFVGGLGGWLSQTLGLTSHWVAAFSTVTVAAVFVPVRNRVQSLLDRRFFRTRYDAAASLQRLAQGLAQSGGRKKLLQFVADEIQHALQTRASVVFLVTGEPPCLVAEAKVGFPDERLKELRLVLDPTLADALSRATVLRREDLAGAPAAFLRRAEASLLVPVRRQLKLLGALGLGAKLSEEGFEADDLQYLGAVAGQLATSLGDLDARARQRELDDAREIQAGLLPRALPALRGVQLAGSWRPARDVAGDYYDVLPLGEDLAALCIADVTGHGMPAALLMSNLQATVKAFATAEQAPRRLCARVNQVMAANVAPGRFITFFYGVLDARRRTLTYANAGHNPPALLRADGTVRWLDVGGLLLGVFPEAVYEQAVVDLLPGDRLLVYTDGVTEAGSGAGELFGEERLLEVLRRSPGNAEDIQREVLRAAAAFCNGEFEDDATVIAAVVE